MQLNFSFLALSIKIDMVPLILLCKYALRYQTVNPVRYHTAFMYCEAMDQVKWGSKTLLYFFQASSAKNSEPSKGLDSLSSRPCTNDLSWATSSFKIGK